MKRLLLCIALTTVSLQGKLFAQEGWLPSSKQSTTEKYFSINPLIVSHRHNVYLQNDAKMIIETLSPINYIVLKNFDSLLSVFMHDIAFYKDSLNTTGNVRIDYVFGAAPAVKKIRFKKYDPDGDLFVKSHNDLSRLKIVQDTVTLLFERLAADALEKKRQLKTSNPAKPISVTFYLNNYTDLNSIIADTETLRHIIDTLATTSSTKKLRSYSTIIYKPYATMTHGYFKKANALLVDDAAYQHHNAVIVANASIGAGLVRNTLTPMAELYAEYQNKWKYGNRWGHKAKYYSFFRLSASPYFFFDKDIKGNHIVNDNWFVNAEIGSTYDNEILGVESKRASLGVGYLFGPKGGYFQNSTFKVFTNIEVLKKVTISPEIIFTNDFKQIFPGITLKVF